MGKNKRTSRDNENAPEILEQRLDLDFKVTSPFKLTAEHDSFVKSMIHKSTKVGFIDGPAGSCKSYCAVLAALHLLKMRAVDDIVYIRSMVESASKQMGALPGEMSDKFYLWSMPLIEKLNEIVPNNKDTLMSHGIIRPLPVNIIRGLTFNRTAVIVDEAQNLTFQELTTIMTRIGEGSKYMIIGDSGQSDIKKHDFSQMFDVFTDKADEEDTPCQDNGILTFKFTEQQVMRSEILKFIVKRIDQSKLDK